MLQLVAPEYHQEFEGLLAEMHRLRSRVFRDRLNWEVAVTDGMEADRFDALAPVYILQRSAEGRIQGCVRLLPTEGPTMLRDVFPELLAGKPAPHDPAIWESSRFALDVPSASDRGGGGIAPGTFELFSGMIEFGLARQLIDIVTVTDVRIERILRRANWPLRRICDPMPIGATLGVAGYLEVSQEALASVRRAGGISGPVLWAPVLSVPHTADILSSPTTGNG